MKPMTYPNYLITIIGMVFLVFASSCKKEPNCQKPDVHYKISNEEKLKVPYTGTDTLKFRYKHYDQPGDTTVDTITYIGKGRVYNEKYLHENAPDDCGQYSFYGETYYIKFKSDTIEAFDLFFRVTADGGSEKFEIGLLGDEIWDLIAAIDNPNLFAGFYPEKVVNGKLYFKVNVFSERGANKTLNIYYSSRHVIIRIEMPSAKSIFELI